MATTDFFFPMFTKRWKMFRTARKNTRFCDGFRDGDRWSLTPADDDCRRFRGFVETRGRRVRLEIIFPTNFPWSEPTFYFPDGNVTHPCVHQDSGLMSPIWGPNMWAPGAAHPEMIMRSLLLVLDEHDIRGKARAS